MAEVISFGKKQDDEWLRDLAEYESQIGDPSDLRINGGTADKSMFFAAIVSIASNKTLSRAVRIEACRILWEGSPVRILLEDLVEFRPDSYNDLDNLLAGDSIKKYGNLK